MITKLTGSIAVFSVAFALFVLFDRFAESLNDGLSEVPAPTALALIDALAPISWLMLILPICIGILYWRLRSESKEYSSIIWHGLIIAGSYLAISVGLYVSSHFVYLDGPRDITVSRIVGNGFLSALVGTGLILAFRTKRSAQPVGGINSESLRSSP